MRLRTVLGTAKSPAPLPTGSSPSRVRWSQTIAPVHYTQAEKITREKRCFDGQMCKLPPWGPAAPSSAK